MTIADQIRNALLSSGRFPEGTDVQIEKIDEAWYALDMLFPQSLQPEEPNEWVEQVMRDISRILPRTVEVEEGPRYVPPGQAQKQLRDDKLYFPRPTGPAIKLRLFAPLLKPDDFE